MDVKRGHSRRHFLQVGIGAAGVGLLAACGQPAPAAPTSAPAKPAAGAPPTAAPAAASQPAAPAATSAPAAAQQAAPQVAPTAVPAVAAKPPQAAEGRLGAQLIGTLQGPTIVTDAAQYPKAF